jgi:hypothetical protein
MRSIANQDNKKWRFAPVMHDCRITPSAHPTYALYLGSWAA